MAATPPIELVALDMAGTTIDEGGQVYDALRFAVEGEGAVVADDLLQRWMGIDKREAIAALVPAGGGPTLDEAGVERTYEHFRELLAGAYRAHPPTPMAGVPEALERLRLNGIAVALTTGFAIDVVGPLLTSLGWEIGGAYIDAVLCADDVAAGRPAPYLIFRAMERTGVRDVRRVAVAGDTHADLEAGTNAGCSIVCGVGTGAVPLVELAAAPHTHLLTDVPELVDLLLDDS